MKSLVIATLAACLAVPVLAACEKKPGARNAGPAKPAAAGVPAALFAPSAPADAVPLVDVKGGAKPGDRVVFEARIGGRSKPFIENRAMFFVADPALKSCDQLHGDACRTPWDYCCETPADLLRNMATVQVVDAEGRPLPVSLENEHGLAPLKTVFVSGTVDQIDTAGNLVVNATSIHVQEG